MGVQLEGSSAKRMRHQAHCEVRGSPRRQHHARYASLQEPRAPCKPPGAPVLVIRATCSTRAVREFSACPERGSPSRPSKRSKYTIFFSDECVLDGHDAQPELRVGVGSWNLAGWECEMRRRLQSFTAKTRKLTNVYISSCYSSYSAHPSFTDLGPFRDTLHRHSDPSVPTTQLYTLQTVSCTLAQLTERPRRATAGKHSRQKSLGSRKIDDGGPRPARLSLAGGYGRIW